MRHEQSGEQHCETDERDGLGQGLHDGSDESAPLTPRPPVFRGHAEKHRNEDAKSPREVAGNPGDYREFIAMSKAEFMVAKNMYVETKGGWFSERSAEYLASGAG